MGRYQINGTVVMRQPGPSDTLLPEENAKLAGHLGILVLYWPRELHSASELAARQEEEAATTNQRLPLRRSDARTSPVRSRTSDPERLVTLKPRIKS